MKDPVPITEEIDLISNINGFVKAGIDVKLVEMHPSITLTTNYTELAIEV